MPTWKRKDGEGNIHFQFLCRSCTKTKQAILEQSGWALVKDGEPVSCDDCVRNCALTTQGLWGAEDPVRYAVCDKCAELDSCPLKGRYFC